MFRDYGIAGQTYYYLQKQQLGENGNLNKDERLGGALTNSGNIGLWEYQLRILEAAFEFFRRYHPAAITKWMISPQRFALCLNPEFPHEQFMKFLLFILRKANFENLDVLSTSEWIIHQQLKKWMISSKITPLYRTRTESSWLIL
ncbi:hypothetical protein OUZ56_022144 [Daphnia magna]|uniref:Transposase n=1 Tax=Daphnia magna TaxID=35525 RepID=A0ABR0AVH2_9CRUS|nr:hypothetical protein OUZ56_022144 [Daphnia magna]